MQSVPRPTPYAASPIMNLMHKSTNCRLQQLFQAATNKITHEESLVTKDVNTRAPAPAAPSSSEGARILHDENRRITRSMARQQQSQQVPRVQGEQPSIKPILKPATKQATTADGGEPPLPQIVNPFRASGSPRPTPTTTPTANRQQQPSRPRRRGRIVHARPPPTAPAANTRAKTKAAQQGSMPPAHNTRSRSTAPTPTPTKPPTSRSPTSSSTNRTSKLQLQQPSRRSKTTPS